MYYHQTSCTTRASFLRSGDQNHTQCSWCGITMALYNKTSSPLNASLVTMQHPTYLGHLLVHMVPFQSWSTCSTSAVIHMLLVHMVPFHSWSIWSPGTPGFSLHLPLSSSITREINITFPVVGKPHIIHIVPSTAHI